MSRKGVHIQEQCDTWLSTERRQKVPPNRDKGPLVRKRAPMSSLFELQWSQNNHQVTATKQTTLNYFFTKPKVRAESSPVCIEVSSQSSEDSDLPPASPPSTSYQSLPSSPDGAVIHPLGSRRDDLSDSTGGRSTAKSKSDESTDDATKHDRGDCSQRETKPLRTEARFDDMSLSIFDSDRSSHSESDTVDNELLGASRIALQPSRFDSMSLSVFDSEPLPRYNKKRRRETDLLNSPDSATVVGFTRSRASDTMSLSVFDSERDSPRNKRRKSAPTNSSNLKLDTDFDRRPAMTETSMSVFDSDEIHMGDDVSRHTGAGGSMHGTDLVVNGTDLVGDLCPQRGQRSLTKSVPLGTKSIPVTSHNVVQPRHDIADTMSLSVFDSEIPHRTIQTKCSLDPRSGVKSGQGHFLPDTLSLSVFDNEVPSVRNRTIKANAAGKPTTNPALAPSDLDSDLDLRGNRHRKLLDTVSLSEFDS